MNRIAVPLFTTGLACLLSSGCQTVTDLGTQIGVATGTITADEGAAIRRTAGAVSKTFQDITPEQEYYIGRAVAATVLSQYPALNDPALNNYISVLGTLLSMASDKPETFGGYHFQVLDSDEVNAFAAPGGFILVTRGMLECCKTEDALAAVLAHEIGHIEGAHGLQAIKQSRLTSALTVLAAESARQFGGQDLKQLTEAFEGSISDIASTLMTSGYSRKLESRADAAAIRIMRNVGYDPNGLVAMLQEMDRHLTPGGKDFAKTHPDPDDRIADVRRMIGSPAPAQPVAARQKRFAAATQKLGRP